MFNCAVRLASERETWEFKIGLYILIRQKKVTEVKGKVKELFINNFVTLQINYQVGTFGIYLGHLHLWQSGNFFAHTRFR